MSRIISYGRDKPQLWEPYYLNPDSPFKPSLSLLFNEGAGASVRDSSGNNNHGVAIGAPLWSPGGLVFDGVNQRCNFGAICNYISGFTLEIVYTPSAAQSTQTRYIFSKYTSATASYFIKTYDTNLVMLAGNVGLTAYNPAELQPGVRMHIVAVFNGASSALYINGTSRATGTTANVAAGNTANLQFSIYDAANFGPLGAVDFARVYSSALTADQVRSLYEAPYQMFVKELPVFYSIPCNMQIFQQYYQRMRSR